MEIALEDGWFSDVVEVSTEDTGHEFEAADATVSEHQIAIHGRGFRDRYFGDPKCSDKAWLDVDLIVSRAAVVDRGNAIHQIKSVSLDEAYDKSYDECERVAIHETLDTGRCVRLSE